MSHAPFRLPVDGQITGRLDAGGDVVVEGRVEGSLVAAGSVSVGESGVVLAEVHASAVYVHGSIIGNVHATQRIELHAGARVVGDLRAPEVALSAGATLEGRVDRQLLTAAPAMATARTVLKSRGSVPKHPIAPPVGVGRDARIVPAAPKPAERCRLNTRPSRTAG